MVLTDLNIYVYSMEEYSNPWKTQSSKVLYQNPWIILEEDQVINPTGNPGIYGKVVFKNRALGIIPLDQTRHTWLVGQYRYTLKEYSWEIPMGGVPFSENILAGAQRELQEETGITASKWTQLLKIHTSNCVTDEVGYCFLAEDLTLGTAQYDETEKLQLRRLPFNEALDMVMSGKITDAISAVSILKLARIKGY